VLYTGTLGPDGITGEWRIGSFGGRFGFEVDNNGALP